jgi:hypothetical protein
MSSKSLCQQFFEKKFHLLEITKHIISNIFLRNSKNFQAYFLWILFLKFRTSKHIS